MRNRHWLLSSVILLCATVALGSCNNPASPAIDNAETPSAPTVSALVGTWKMSSSSSFEGTTTTMQDIITLSSDGSFVQESIVTSTPPSDVATTFYTWKKGTIGISGDKLTMTETGNVPSSASAATPSTDSWTSSSSVTTSTAVLVAGKLYKSAIFKAQGSNSGIVGTWIAESYTSSKPKPYSKIVLALSSDKTFTQTIYASTSADYPDAPQTGSGSYVLNSNGSMTETISGSTYTSFYKVVGSYFIMGDETSADANAYTKQ